MRKNWSKILVCKLNDDGFKEEVVAPHKKSEIDSRDKEMERRLVDWGNVVNPPYAASNQASTFWAARYYEIRNSNFRRELILRGLIEQKTVMQKIEDQVAAELRYQDALLVDSAWTRLRDPQQKQALLMRYVFRHKDEYIRSRLGVRGRQNLTLISWRARISLKQILEREKNADIIRSDNLNLFAG